MELVRLYGVGGLAGAVNPANLKTHLGVFLMDFRCIQWDLMCICEISCASVRSQVHTVGFQVQNVGSHVYVTGAYFGVLDA